MTTILLAVAGLLEYSVRGKSELFPSLADRARRHVDAGAEMTRIHRLAVLYNLELRAGPQGNYMWLASEQRSVS